MNWKKLLKLTWKKVILSIVLMFLGLFVIKQKFLVPTGGCYPDPQNPNMTICWDGIKFDWPLCILSVITFLIISYLISCVAIFILNRIR